MGQAICLDVRVLIDDVHTDRREHNSHQASEYGARCWFGACSGCFGDTQPVHRCYQNYLLWSTHSRHSACNDEPLVSVTYR